MFSLSGVVVSSEPLSGVLFPSSGVLSTLPSVLPSGVWVVPPVTDPPASELAPSLTFPFSALSLPDLISVVLIWADSPCVLPSGLRLGCCVLSDVLPLVVEFSFG